MPEPTGFVRWNAHRQRFEVDWRKSLSIVVGELLLQEIVAARSSIIRAPSGCRLWVTPLCRNLCTFGRTERWY
jgi:hypothetical protein